MTKVYMQILEVKVYNFSTWVEKNGFSLYAKNAINNGKCNKNFIKFDRMLTKDQAVKAFSEANNSKTCPLNLKSSPRVSTFVKSIEKRINN
jgi:hypothetical protein